MLRKDEYMNTQSLLQPNINYNESTADEFSVTKAYSTGNYCIYNNILYKFTSDKAAGAWDSSKVTSTTVAGELSSLNTNIDDFGKHTTNDLNDTHNQQSDLSVVIRVILSNASNSPDGTATGFVISFRDTEAWGSQFAVMNGVVFTRQKKNGAWQSWAY